MTNKKNSNQHTFNCTSIGLIAAEALVKAQDAQIIGKTSKGIFIKTSGKWLVFLAFENFKGPLTITLDRIDPSLQQISRENVICITPETIILPNLDMTIILRGAPVWQPPPPSTPLLGNLEREANLVYVAQEILSKKKGTGLSSLIPPLLGLPETPSPHQLIYGFDWPMIQQIKMYLQNVEILPLTRLLSTFLGSGPGLTPSADDFILGLLLALNRWRIPPWETSDLHTFNFHLVEAAYKKTTTLSSNLIECASRGWANERLINALDWLVTGVASEPDVIDHMLDWGNSSGVDAFTGMVTSLTA